MYKRLKYKTISFPSDQDHAAAVVVFHTLFKIKETINIIYLMQSLFPPLWFYMGSHKS